MAGNLKRPTRLSDRKTRSPSLEDPWRGLEDSKTPLSPSRALADALNGQQLQQRGKSAAKPHATTTNMNNNNNNNSKQVSDAPGSDYHISFAIDESGICVSESSNSIRQISASITPAEQQNSSSGGLSGNTEVPDERQQQSDDARRPTHRCEHAFMPRHHDELAIDVGDPVIVDRVADDNWCYGTNLRTGNNGIFPQPHVIEVDICDEIINNPPTNDRYGVSMFERDTFYLTYLGSVEVAHHKGNDVLVQAVNKLLHVYHNKEEAIVPKSVLLSVSYHGIHMIQKAKMDWFRCPSFDYFYSLQNISFCGAHPKQHKYFGFMTKHPLLPRFACHVFASNESTQPLVEAVGTRLNRPPRRRAFKRSYDEYMAFQHPTEDIFLE